MQQLYDRDRNRRGHSMKSCAPLILVYSYCCRCCVAGASALPATAAVAAPQDGVFSVLDYGAKAD